MKQEILNMNSVQDYNENLGVETLHPLVSVVDMSELSEIKHSLKRFGFYGLIPTGYFYICHQRCPFRCKAGANGFLSGLSVYLNPFPLYIHFYV